MPRLRNAGPCRSPGRSARRRGLRAAARRASWRIRSSPSLAIAHVDCDAFYASVEKRDRPELADQPVIVGGGQRGVVLTACYVARRYGVRSAMPMARAVQLCPDADDRAARHGEIPPRIAPHPRADDRAAPVVEQVSIDEAYLDLSEARAQEPPARALARLALLVERRVGVTVSIGLAPNKMLAKLASDLGKPRGFSIIGAGDARGGDRADEGARRCPASARSRRSEARGDGLHDRRRSARGQRRRDDPPLRPLGPALGRFAHAEDPRRVSNGRGRAVTVGAERTFERDLSRLDEIEPQLAALCASGRRAAAARRPRRRRPHPQAAPRRPATPPPMPAGRATRRCAPRPSSPRCGRCWRGSPTAQLPAGRRHRARSGRPARRRPARPLRLDLAYNEANFAGPLISFNELA